MPEADRAGIRTYWTSFGQGPQAGLAIHCSLAHSGSWGPLARHVSGALSLTAFDMPGHGRSADWSAPDDAPDEPPGEIQGATAEIAAGFLNQPAHVIGHSFGATVALRLALARPDLVRSLILIEPVFFAVALRDRPEIGPGFEAQMAGFTEAMEAGDRFAAARAFLEVWGDGVDWEALAESEQARLAAQMPVIAAGHPALYEDVGGMLAPGRLEALDVPVLLLEGSASPAIIPAINDGLAARLPRAQRAVVAGAGHMLPLTHARQVGAEMLRFLRQVEP